MLLNGISISQAKNLTAVGIYTGIPGKPYSIRDFDLYKAA